MKTTLNTSDIAHALKSDENANWSWNGAKALAEHLEEYEESTGEELELDVCAIRCDFSEYKNMRVFLEDHFGKALSAAIELAGIEIENLNEEEELDDEIRSYIQDHGQLIEFDGGVIVSSF